MSFNIEVSAEWFKDTEFSLQKAYVMSTILVALDSDYDGFNRNMQYWGIRQARYFERKGVIAAVIIHHGCAFVAFKGRTIVEEHRFLSNTVQMGLDANYSHGNTHSEMQVETIWVWQDIRNYLADVDFENLYFIGHGTGGMMAVIAMSWYGYTNSFAYTFGSPRIGDLYFKRYVESRYKCYRIVNNRDPISNMPVSPWYYHVGSRVLLDKGGQVISKPKYHMVFEWMYEKWTHLIGKQDYRDKDHDINKYKKNLQIHALSDPIVVNHYLKHLAE